MSQSHQECRLAPPRMVEALHGEQLPVHRVVCLIQQGSHYSEAVADGFIFEIDCDGIVVTGCFSGLGYV